MLIRLTFDRIIDPLGSRGIIKYDFLTYLFSIRSYERFIFIVDMPLRI